jgi:integrating conjugative element protein (TIGR03757 family)
MILPSLSNAQTPITFIDIFTESPVKKRVTYIPNTHIAYFDFEAPLRVSKKIPVFANNEQKAYQQFQQWKNNAESKKILAELKDSYNAQLRALKYKITKTPAIVFDQGKYVIYGSTDVGRAVRDYDLFKKGKGQ